MESATDVAFAALIYREGFAEFSDLMVLQACRRAEVKALYTFDERTASRLDGVEAIPVAKTTG